MEENNDIFLTGGDALVYLAEPMHKKFSTKFVWRYPFSTYLSYDRSFNLRPLYAPVHIFDDPLPFHSPVVYLIDGLFLNQKTNNNIRISYSLKYNHLKKINSLRAIPVQRFFTWWYDGNIVVKYVFSKSCCGKHFSKPCEA